MPDTQVPGIVVVLPLNPQHGRVEFDDCVWERDSNAGMLWLVNVAGVQVGGFRLADLLGWYYDEVGETVEDDGNYGEVHLRPEYGAEVTPDA